MAHLTDLEEASKEVMILENPSLHSTTGFPQQFLNFAEIASVLGEVFIDITKLSQQLRIPSFALTISTNHTREQDILPYGQTIERRIRPMNRAYLICKSEKDCFPISNLSQSSRKLQSKWSKQLSKWPNPSNNKVARCGRHSF